VTSPRNRRPSVDRINIALQHAGNQEANPLVPRYRPAPQPAQISRPASDQRPPLPAHMAQWSWRALLALPAIGAMQWCLDAHQETSPVESMPWSIPAAAAAAWGFGEIVAITSVVVAIMLGVLAHRTSNFARAEQADRDALMALLVAGGVCAVPIGLALVAAAAIALVYALIIALFLALFLAAMTIFIVISALFDS